MIIVSDIFDVLVFGDGSLFNQELIKIYQQTNFDLYLFTSAPFTKETKLIQPFIKDFKDVFNTKMLGMGKSNLEIYKLLAEKIGVKPEKIIFLDDKEYNAQAAIEAGCQGIHYQNNDQILKIFHNLNILNN